MDAQSQTEFLYIDASTQVESTPTLPLPTPPKRKAPLVLVLSDEEEDLAGPSGTQEFSVS